MLQRSLFNHLGPCTVHERKHFPPFSFRNLKLVEGRLHVAQEELPILGRDAHPLVGRRHIPTRVVQGLSRTSTKEIDGQLFLATNAILPSMSPKADELGVRHQTRK